MANPKVQDPMDEIIERIRFPHLETMKGKWLKTSSPPASNPGASFDRLCYYGEKLRALGMSDGDIACMFGDLYWDAFEEFKLNAPPR